MKKLVTINTMDELKAALEKQPVYSDNRKLFLAIDSSGSITVVHTKTMLPVGSISCNQFRTTKSEEQFFEILADLGFSKLEISLDIQLGETEKYVLSHLDKGIIGVLKAENGAVFLLDDVNQRTIPFIVTGMNLDLRAIPLGVTLLEDIL